MTCWSPTGTGRAGPAARRGQRSAVQGQPGRHAVRRAGRGASGHRRGMERRRLRAVRRDRGPADRRSCRGAERRADQDRRPGARRAYRQVQPAAPDRGGTWSRGGLRRAVVPASALICADQAVARIENRARLTDHGDQELRATVLDLAEVALAALSPSAGLRRSVALDGKDLIAGGRSYDLSAVDRLVLLGAGKASAELATAVERLLGPRLDGGVLVVPPAAEKPLSRLTVLPGEHPVPGPASVAGARALLEQAGRSASETWPSASSPGAARRWPAFPRRVSPIPTRPGCTGCCCPPACPWWRSTRCASTCR